jgi:hypothetical protein
MIEACSALFLTVTAKTAPQFSPRHNSAMPAEALNNLFASVAFARPVPDRMDDDFLIGGKFTALRSRLGRGDSRLFFWREDINLAAFLTRQGKDSAGDIVLHFGGKAPYGSDRLFKELGHVTSRSTHHGIMGFNVIQVQDGQHGAFRSTTVRVLTAFSAMPGCGAENGG